MVVKYKQTCNESTVTADNRPRPVHKVDTVKSG